MKIPIIDWTLELNLKLLGFWPDQFSIFGLMIMFASYTVLLPFQCWDAVGLIEKPVLLMDSLSAIIAEFLAFLKFTIMWINRRYLLNVLREMASDFDEKDVRDKWVKLNYYSHKFSRYDFGWYLGACLMYHVQFFQLYFLTPVEERITLLKANYPFDYKSTPNYEIIYVVQTFIGTSIAGINAMTEALIVALVLHICGHIELLIDKIKLFSDHCGNITDNNINVNNKSQFLIREILKRHLKVLNLVKKIDHVYTYVSLAQMLFSTIIICLTGFVIIYALETNDTVLLAKFIMYIFVLLWQAFSFCFAGQYLLNKSAEIPIKMYDTFWYNIEPKEIKAVLFIIKKAQIPISIKSGKLDPLSVEGFARVVKTSFSFLSVLRATV